MPEHSRRCSAACSRRTGALVLTLAASVLGGCGAGTPARQRPPVAGADTAPAGTVPVTTTTNSPVTTTAVASTPAAPPRRRHPLPPDPGRLPQTSTLPSASSHVFRDQMAALWNGVRLDRVTLAMPAFFPQAAYAQLKAIADPEGDWSGRLVADYAQDIAAAHALLGAGATSARLVSVVVPPGYAHWIPPDVCYNTVGYWETPNSRMVYSEGGQERSFGIASLISWRGVWYVVHLGAVLRPYGGGTVDAPASGSGYAAPSSTC